MPERDLQTSDQVGCTHTHHAKTVMKALHGSLSTALEYDVGLHEIGTYGMLKKQVEWTTVKAARKIWLHCTWAQNKEMLK
eukprot:210390-Pelagomonas_calceolata.AAC.3